MIALRGVSKAFDAVPAIVDFSLEISCGSFFVLVGPSGCGKSTVLRMINAMSVPDRGQIEVNGRDIRKVEPQKLRRSIGYVIQSGGLFPHWTAAENILAVPRLLKWNRAQCAERLDALIDLLHIDKILLHRYPRELSGGQQQRIGVARALAADPAIVLMDEPFAALDPVSRAALQEELRKIHARSGKTIVFVTHDMDEALSLATQMGVMNGGRLAQSGAPATILMAPANDFVRDFLGGEARHLRLLDLIAVEKVMKPGWSWAAETIAAKASLKRALNMMLARGCSKLRVVDESGATLGEIALNDVVAKRDAG